MINKGSGSSTIKQFLKENRTLAFTVPILLVLIVVVLIVYSNLGGEKPSKDVPAVAESTPGQLEGNRVEVLPQKERTQQDSASTTGTGSENAAGTGSDSTAGQEGVKDPFTGPLTLTGVVISADGNNIAVIEGNGKSYLVKKDDVIEGNLVVESIAAGEVILKDGDREIPLKLEQRKSSQAAAK